MCVRMCEFVCGLRGEDQARHFGRPKRESSRDIPLSHPNFSSQKHANNTQERRLPACLIHAPHILDKPNSVPQIFCFVRHTLTACVAACSAQVAVDSGGAWCVRDCACVYWREQVNKGMR